MTGTTDSPLGRSLPSSPSLQHLRDEAKSLLKTHKKGDPSCCGILKQIRRFQDQADDDILRADVSLHDVQFALAMEYGYKSWGELKRNVLGKTDSLKCLHIHNLDLSAQAIADSSVEGDNLVWRETYIEGPVPGNVSEDEFRHSRARYLTEAGLTESIDGALRGLTDRYRVIEEAGKYEEVALWFDSCMFDQTIMIHVIDLCARQQWEGTGLSLICVDGALGGANQAELFGTRQAVTADAADLAGRGWMAFTSGNPTDIEALLQGDFSDLPYLGDALRRHLEQYPSVSNGLDRTQKQVLRTVAGGARKLDDIFVAVSDMEERPFMGDASMWACIDELAGNREPLLTLDGPGRLSDHMDVDPRRYDAPALRKLRQWDVSITDQGKSVLDGREDHIRLNGIDRWLGGVHLTGPQPQWRWDEDRGRLVALGSSSDRPVGRRPRVEARSPRKSEDRMADASHDLSAVKMMGNGHREDSFSHMIVGAAALLGKSVDYDAVFAASTNGFAPGIETDRWCPGEWSFRGKERAIDLAAQCAGLSARMLELPAQPRFSGSQEEAAIFMQDHRRGCVPVIREAMHQEAVVLTTGGWLYRGKEYSNNPGYEWGDAFYQWGIITSVTGDGTIAGACMNGRNDNPLGYMEDCWAILPADADPDPTGVAEQILQRAVDRIRGEGPIYSAYRRYGYNYTVGEQVFGVQAMDVWMERFSEIPFCRLGCGDSSFYCPSRAVVPAWAGARFSAGYLQSQGESTAGHHLQAAAESYERIAERLAPFAPLGSYEGIMGDIEKQREHVEKVLQPVKDEMSRAADAIERELSSR